MTRLVDVAKRAGVSVSTASYVVTGSRPVSPDTRQRVLDAIQETGYTPNAVARALRSARSRTIAIVIPNIQNAFFAAVIDGVDLEARAGGQALMFVNTGEDPDREVTALRDLNGQQIDGMIIGITRQTPPSVLQSLRESRRPVVFIDRAGPEGSDQVLVANEIGAKVMVDHLAAIGHLRIGMVAGVAGISPATDRLAGYRAGLEASGIPFDPQLVIDGGSRRAVAHVRVLELLRSTRRPSALVVGNNDMTHGTLEAIHEFGARIPDDLAIVSLDDLPMGNLLASPLTAVAQPGMAMGREAMRLLLRRVESPDAPPRTIRLRPEFIHRASCGCGRAGALTDGRLSTAGM